MSSRMFPLSLRSASRCALNMTCFKRMKRSYDGSMLLCLLSSQTDTESSSSDLESSSRRSRTGPVKVMETPRSAAAARLRTTNSYGLNGFKESGIPTKGPELAKIQPETPPPFRLEQFGEASLYTLVLLRHGESEWNAQNRFTGWVDVNLTTRGEKEARDAGRLLFQDGIELDQAYTSVLKRASFTCNMALNMAGQHWVPVTKSWLLNERHYGSLQGYHKDTAWKELNFDQELVMQMRRSYDVRPPRMENDHPHWHGGERRYRSLTPEQLDRTRSESLKDTADRIMPFFNSVIIPSMQSGNKCIIVSHGNTIRTLVKHIDNISDEDIKGMTIPTGIPLLYRLDKDMKPVDPTIELEFRYMVEPKGYTWGTSRAHGFHGVYLGDQERLQEIQKKRDQTNRDWQRIILCNIGKSLGWTFEELKDAGENGTELSSASTGNITSGATTEPLALEVRQLLWNIHQKIVTPGYSNMLMLASMIEELESMYGRRQKFISKNKYEQLINQLHLDSKGKVVEPFVALANRQDRLERQKIWYEAMALDLEEECLIK